MRKLFACLVAGLLASSSLALTGTVSYVYQDIFPVHYVQMTYQTGTVGTNAGASTMAIGGTLDRVVFCNNSTSTVAVTCKDAQGIDFFNGLATGIAANSTNCLLYDKGSVNTQAYRWVFAGPLALSVTNQTSSAQSSGTVTLYYRVGP